MDITYSKLYTLFIRKPWKPCLYESSIWVNIRYKAETLSIRIIHWDGSQSRNCVHTDYPPWDTLSCEIFCDYQRFWMHFTWTGNVIQNDRRRLTKGRYYPTVLMTLRWRHNGSDSVSNHQPHHCLLNRLFGRRSKKTSKLRVTGLCAGNSPGTGEFPAEMASNAENVSIWWRDHDMGRFDLYI